MDFDAIFEKLTTFELQVAELELKSLVEKGFKFDNALFYVRKEITDRDQKLMEENGTNTVRTKSA